MARKSLAAFFALFFAFLTSVGEAAGAANLTSVSDTTHLCRFYHLGCTTHPPKNVEIPDPKICEIHRMGIENCSLSHPEENLDFACLSLYNDDGSRLISTQCFIWHANNPCSCTHSDKCCCMGNLCNNRTIGDWTTSTPRTSFSRPSPPSSQNIRSTLLTAYSSDAGSQLPKGNRKAVIIGVSLFCSLLILTLIVTLSLWYYFVWYKDKKLSRDSDESHFIKSDSLGEEIASLDDLVLVKQIGMGRFAEVWQVDFMGKEAAIKIFPESEKLSWKTEVDTYTNPKLIHEGVLNFWAAEKRLGLEGIEYWLMTDFHSNGSLRDYLKSHVISPNDMCVMSYSLAAGLAYLHSKQKNGQSKPGIAHRDLKSQNVLIKNNGTCCISDFGLATKFYPSQGLTPAHGQVGTVRYMAPEVLEGAIHFQEEAFLRTDIYALGLMFWEMGSRCAVGNGSSVPQYQQPYEEAVSPNPSIEEMHEVVVASRYRPNFSSQWYCVQALEIFRETVEECWDSDAEARLTAECVQERIKQCRAALAMMSNGETIGAAVVATTAVNTPPAVSNGRNGCANLMKENGDIDIAATLLPNGIGAKTSCRGGGGGGILNGICPPHSSTYYRGTGYVPNASINGLKQNSVLPALRGLGGGPGPGGSYREMVFDSSSSSCPPPYSPTPDVAIDIAMHNLKKDTDVEIEKESAGSAEKGETSV